MTLKELYMIAPSCQIFFKEHGHYCLYSGEQEFAERTVAEIRDRNENEFPMFKHALIVTLR